MPTTIASVHAFALTLPDTTAAVACAGTAIESRTAVTTGKAFLFAGAGALRFKLAASIPAVAKLATAEPDRYEVGKGGWVKVTVRDGRFPPMASLRRWIAESHALCTRPVKGVGKGAAKRPAPAQSTAARSTAARSTAARSTAARSTSARKRAPSRKKR